jgi:hypothetical protein
LKESLMNTLLNATVFNPKTLLPISSLKEDWEGKRIAAWGVLVDDESDLKPLERAVAPVLPIILLLNIVLLLLAVKNQFQVVGMTGGNFFASNPVIIFSSLILVAFLVVTARITTRAEKLKNSADNTVFISVGNWIQHRYGVEVDYIQNLSDIMADEKARNINNAPYYLTVKNEFSEKYLIVLKADGTEAEHA